MYDERSERRGRGPIHLLAPSRQVQRYGSLTRSIFYFGLCALIKLQATCPRRAHRDIAPATPPNPSHNSASQTICSTGRDAGVFSHHHTADLKQFQHVSGDQGCAEAQWSSWVGTGDKSSVRVKFCPCPN